MIIIKRLQQRNQMHRRTTHRTKMKDLVRATPDIEEAWAKSLWEANLSKTLATHTPRKTPDSSMPTYRIDKSTRDVK
jgi:hypothetical protein